MPRFFVSKENIKEDKIIIKGEDAKHIATVLRHKKNDKIEVSNGEGLDYTCIIEEIEKKEILLKIEKKEKNKTEPKVKIKLYQGIPKSTKLELVIQKTIELGVSEIQPFTSENTVVKTNDKTLKKFDRYNKISMIASKQSNRGIVPKIKSPISYEQCLDNSKNNDLNILAYEKELDNTLKNILKKVEKNNIKTVGIFVGAEGGFTEKEIKEAVEYKINIATLGKIILRTETAGISLVNIVMYELND